LLPFANIQYAKHELLKRLLIEKSPPNYNIKLHVKDEWLPIGVKRSIVWFLFIS